MKNIGTLPNLISLSRLIAGLFFIPLNNTFHFGNIEIIIIILLAWLSDLLDGWVARKTNQISDIGKFIDPVADKIFVVALILTFYFSDKIDLFYLVAVIGRDILIIIGGYLVQRKIKIVLPSNLLGKLCVFIIGIYFITVLIEAVSLAKILEWVSVILIFASLIVYFLRAYELIKDLKYVYKEN